MKNRYRILAAVLLSLILMIASAPSVMAASSNVKVNSVQASSAKRPSQIYYFDGGVGTDDFTGIVNIGGKQYYVKNGKVRTDYSGTVNRQLRKLLLQVVLIPWDCCRMNLCSSPFL